MRRRRPVSVVVAAIALGLPGTQACGGKTEEVGIEDGVDAPKGTYLATVDALMQTRVEKLDLLFVIDNSPSMADQQLMLSEAVPALVERLANPLCVSSNDPSVSQRVSVDERCPSGFVREFQAIDDIHVGVVSTSLGGHGADSCSPNSPAFNPTQDDHAHLTATMRPDFYPTLQSYQGRGFLAWDPQAKNKPTGESDFNQLIADFKDQVRAVGEVGCPFSAPLEAMYRFLIDPEPPLAVQRDPANPSVVVVQGIDDELLAQRAAFLRPDSLVSIVMVTDKNDYSVIDGGTGWLALQSTNPDGSRFHLPRATSACAKNPSDPCCRSCGLVEAAPPPGCAALATDPDCMNGPYDEVGDALPLRCWDEKRRFGFDFLHRIQRYADGLLNPTITNHAGQQVANPLYSDLSGGNALPRDPSLVFVTAVVGVPWQDLATDDTRDDPSRLRYLSGTELRVSGRWDMLLGTADAPATDALMWETLDDRTTLGAPPHPLLGVPLAPATSTALTNPINGHEYSIPDRNDLQYACITPLATPRDCSIDAPGCDCGTDSLGINRPVCEGTLQIAAKAYPGLRELALLKAMDRNGIDNGTAGSICPKITDPTNPDFGYLAIFGITIERLRGLLAAKCLPQPLAVDDRGQVACTVVEASWDNPCDCNRPGRHPPSDAAMEMARREMALIGCSGTSCQQKCFCEIDQLSGSALEECRMDLAGARDGGFCYADPDQGANPAFVNACNPTERQALRFTGEGTPESGAIVVIGCGAVEQTAGLGPKSDGAIGAPCIPSLERDASFNGFQLNEVAVEVGSAGCETGVCLVDHFRGRTSCPYGQSPDEIASGSTFCRVPGTSSPVVVPVDPQLTTRRARDAAYCSCRCDGAGPGPFCACPLGFECVPLVPSLGDDPLAPVAGSYCAKSRPEDDIFTPREDCSRIAQNCDS